MNKKDFFRNYGYGLCIFCLLWPELSQEDISLFTTMKHIGILPITIFLFVLGIVIDYFLNKDESFIKSKINTFNTVIFLLVILIAFLIRYRLL
jgi:hypothetical protein